MTAQPPPPEETPEKMVSSNRIASLLGITNRSVLNHFHSKRIPGYRIGKSIRFRVSEVLAAVEGKN